MYGAVGAPRGSKGVGAVLFPRCESCNRSPYDLGGNGRLSAIFPDGREAVCLCSAIEKQKSIYHTQAQTRTSSSMRFTISNLVAFSFVEELASGAVLLPLPALADVLVTFVRAAAASAAAHRGARQGRSRGQVAGGIFRPGRILLLLLLLLFHMPLCSEWRSS